MSDDVIDHYREAESTLEVIEFAHGAQTAPSYTEYALAEATLAIAYEQRTANLIAAFTQLRGDDGITLLEDAYPLLDQIKERLGL